MRIREKLNRRDAFDPLISVCVLGLQPSPGSGVGCTSVSSMALAFRPAGHCCVRIGIRYQALSDHRSCIFLLEGRDILLLPEGTMNTIRDAKGRRRSAVGLLSL